MYVLLTITTDYTDNFTETVFKSVFCGWRRVVGCWTSSDTSYESEEDDVEDGSPPIPQPLKLSPPLLATLSPPSSLSVAVVSPPDPAIGVNSHTPIATVHTYMTKQHAPEKYYQSTS
jgi:hypothetical protein